MSSTSWEVVFIFIVLSSTIIHHIHLRWHPKIENPMYNTVFWVDVNEALCLGQDDVNFCNRL